ncbi:HIT-like domain-containing protein [Hygrophoropsis aurantiaca]|uniref:HIT-like domain-containing protein n=1 Tax=Hygrophoropsis aurantiaca TaxID=72124 RepID=A0ACB8A891_9AGAM|nr:HIT-like domain-containing protein [Hygrophoropsis aurantiaca]
MTSTTKYLADCIFCKIIKGEIPSYKLLETAASYSFLDIGPLSKGHALIIPKYHSVKMHELPDENLTDVMVMAKKIALGQGIENYNILQNNGRIAHQEVEHVHFHVIPKPSDDQGLVLEWKTLPKNPDPTEAAKEMTEIQKKVHDFDRRAGKW